MWREKNGDESEQIEWVGNKKKGGKVNTDLK